MLSPVPTRRQPRPVRLRSRRAPARPCFAYNRASVQSPLRLALLAALFASTLSTAHAQPATSTANGVTINGPAPPVAPETVARDGQGRVTLRATRISTPMKMDGRLDEEPYRLVKPMGDFVQTDPKRGEPATEQTEFWIFYDDNAIYVGAKCYDSSPEDAWVANEMRRDSMNVVRNENFSIYFDTFYDRRNAFLFELSPIGGIYDAYVTNERSPGNTDYNPVWSRQAGRFDGGWIAEMAIPFRALRYRPGAGEQPGRPLPSWRRSWRSPCPPRQRWLRSSWRTRSMSSERGRRKGRARIRRPGGHAWRPATRAFAHGSGRSTQAR